MITFCPASLTPFRLRITGCTLLFGLMLNLTAIPAHAAGNSQREGAYTNTIAAISNLVSGYVASNEVVGLSLVLTDSDGIIWSQGFGWADREEGVPATGDTIYRLASLSKLFAAIGTLREQEQGHLELDRPVADYMSGFAPVPRPDHSAPPIDYTNNPVTVRAMLCHLSGIQNAYTPYSETFEDDPDFLMPNIESASTDYGCLPPDLLVCYNNNGFQFAEYLITLHNTEGLTYSEYIQNHLFSPLAMTRSGFDMDALADTGDLATSYDYAHDRSAREYMNCLGTGGALSCANDMAQFLRMIMQEGSGTVSRVLTPESVAAMLCNQTTNIGLAVGNKSLATGLGWDSAVLPELEYAGGGCSKFGAIVTYGVYGAIATNHQLGVFVALNTPQSDVATSVGNTMLQAAVEEKTGLAPPVATLPVSPFAGGSSQALADSLAGYYVNGSYTDIAAGDNCLIYSGADLYLRDDGWWAASNSPAFLLGFTNEQGCTFSLLKQPTGNYLDTTVTGMRCTPPAEILPAWSNRLDTTWLIASLADIEYNRTHEGLVAGRFWATNGMLMLTLPNIFLGQADKGFDVTSDYVLEAQSDTLALVQGCGYTLPCGIDILDDGRRFRATNYEWQNTDTIPVLSDASSNSVVTSTESMTWFAFDAEQYKQYTFAFSDSASGLFMITDGDGHSLGASTQSSVLTWTPPDTGRYYISLLFEDTAPSTVDLLFQADTDQVILTASVSAHGSIDPAGSFSTNRGASVTVDIACETYWAVSDILTNGTSSGLSGVDSFTWTDLQADAVLDIQISALTALSNTPLWWLAQYGWTTDFDAAAAADPDSDGLPTWQEYVFSTCPTNADTDGDQYSDGAEALTGADPLHDDTQTYGAILDHPLTYELYTSNSIGDLAFDCFMEPVTTNQQVDLVLQPAICDDLTAGSWTNIGLPVLWNMSAETNKAFYRIHRAP